MQSTVLGHELIRSIENTTLEALAGSAQIDAIVVGAGAAGGTAAMLLSEAGLTVLVLDAGWPIDFLQAPFFCASSAAIRTVADPRLQTLLPPSVLNAGRKALKAIGRLRQPIQSRCFAWEMAPESFVQDYECPYINEAGTTFHWFRTRQLGGRMVLPGHGRQYYRLPPRDFSPTDSLSPDWPFNADELNPWYDFIEKRLGLSGSTEDSHWLPRSIVTHKRTASPAEEELRQILTARWPATQPVLSRFAPALPALDIAARNGRLLCRQGAIVRDVLTDGRRRACGVRWYDRRTRSLQTVKAPLVFLCASGLESTRILLCSNCCTGPSADILGKFLMDHVLVSGFGIGSKLPGGPVIAESGRCVYVHFENRSSAGSKPGRGYGVQIYRWSRGRDKSFFNAVSFAEMTPRPENRVVLDPLQTDAWGMPILRFHCQHNSVELGVSKEQSTTLGEIAELLHVRMIKLDTIAAPAGTAMHECGTARMGSVPEDSVLDPYNQCWDTRGLYVTDASAFPSQGTQNPTLTILALTARACHHALLTT